jgi:5,10-methylene-tetrahydrofolate dehydrogenase/methenyl tetrahydrofolate cyclohydrolase
MTTEPSDRSELILDPATLAEKYIAEVHRDVLRLGVELNVVGLIASDDKPSLAYARATKQKFDTVGINYDLRQVERLELEAKINAANEDPHIHGIFIYFPVFYNPHDDYLRNQVNFRKDVEAGSTYWTKKIVANDRTAVAGDDSRKAVLPCTSLAIVKMLTEIGAYAVGEEQPIDGKVVTIFNRSEVIGRPLAVMMSNDGAKVHSFDINGPLEFVEAIPRESSITRRQALLESDIVITGVPTDSFEKIRCEEIRDGTICLNFSSFPNFEEGIDRCRNIYIPRIGPMTVAMCMRNSFRLYTNFHQKGPP